MSSKKQLTEEQREAQRAYQRKYYQEHKESVKAKAKKYYDNHKDAVLERNKQYRKDHADELKEKNKQYAEKNKEQIAERKHNWYEENKESVIARVTQWNKDHPEEHKEYCRRYETKHGICNHSFEQLTDEDTVSESTTSWSDVVLDEMQDLRDANYDEFVQLAKACDLTNEEDIKKLYDFRAKNNIGRKMGSALERLIRRQLLNELKDTDLKLYKQVPINDGTCRIDFVVTKEVVDDKSKLQHLDHAVIVSTKTSNGTHWREDMHLYDKCAAYIMVNVEADVPTETLPDNVYFCSAKATTETDHIIQLDNLGKKLRLLFSASV